MIQNKRSPAVLITVMALTALACPTRLKYQPDASTEDAGSTTAGHGGAGAGGMNAAGSGGIAGLTGAPGGAPGGASQLGGATGAAGAAGGPNVGSGGTGPCTDRVKDGAETDIDCGGGSCPKCDVNKTCASDGDCKTGSCSRLFCALVSGPPNWFSGPSLTDGRGLAVVAAAPLANDRMLLLAMGGRDDTDDSNPPIAQSYELLDTSQTQVAWTASIPDSVEYPASAVTDANGDILLFSSSATWRLGGNGVLNMLSAAMPTPRSSTAAALAPNGMAYVLGGDGPSGVVGTVEAYNPATAKWTTGLTAMPTPRDSFAAAVGTDGRLYTIGGQGNTSDAASTVEAYDIATNTWSTASSLPSGDFYVAAVSAPDGRIYELGGTSNMVNAYSPVTNRWTSVAPLSDNRTGVGAVVAPDGHIYAVGGTTNVEGAGETTVQIYGPAVTASLQTGMPGTSVSINGGNFAANATVAVYVGAVTSTPLASGTTDASGSLVAPINFTVPSLPAGNQSLIVMDDRSQFPIALNFRVQ